MTKYLEIKILKIIIKAKTISNKTIQNKTIGKTITKSRKIETKIRQTSSTKSNQLSVELT